ncbi:hypothetical protein, partial [Agrococcus citreus]|uniref:hypothetical protein n=1 Tax=Agrococcus citreus TaxID=84643 RepID=UPI0031D18FFE
MPKTRTPALLLTVAVTALGLTSCMMPTSAPASEPAAVEETQPAETTEAAPAETEEAAAPAAAGDLTPPGTELAIGEPATVTFSSGTTVTDAPLTVTVTGVEEGSIADYEAAGLDQDFLDQLAGYRTYYVTVEATKADPAGVELAYTALYSDMGALDSNGQRMQTVSLIGDFAPCNTESFPSEIDEGATVTTCYVVAGTEAVEFGSATYEPYEGDYSPSDGEPIRWS